MHAQPGAQEAPASDSSSDASGTSASWAELHQLLLSSIGACLAGDKPSLLAARACCCAWRAALSPQLRQLRLHVAPGASSSGVGGPPPGSLLASSLARGLPGVTSVTLVLTHHTSDDDLAGALASVGAQVCGCFDGTLCSAGTCAPACIRTGEHEALATCCSACRCTGAHQLCLHLGGGARVSSRLQHQQQVAVSAPVCSAAAACCARCKPRSC